MNEHDMQDVSLHESELVHGGSDCSDFWGGVANGLGLGALVTFGTPAAVGLGAAAIGAKLIQSFAC